MAAEEAFAQIMRFEQTTELQQRGGVGHAIGSSDQCGQNRCNA